MKSANNEIGTSVTKDRKVRSFKSLSTILISFDFSLVFSFKAFYLICFLYTYFNWPSKAADLHQLQQCMRTHTHTVACCCCCCLQFDLAHFVRIHLNVNDVGKSLIAVMINSRFIRTFHFTFVFVSFRLILIV